MHFNTEAKASLVLFFWTCAFTLPCQAQIVLIIIIIALEAIAKPFHPFSFASHRSFIRFFFYMILLSSIIIILNGILIHTGVVRYRFGFIEFYNNGLLFGISVAVRLVLMSLSVLLFFVSTPMREFAYFLDRRGIPHVIVSILLLSVYFIEQLPQRIHQIFTAQEARGAPVHAGILSRAKAFFSILSPLVLSSIIESIERSVALEIRGYHMRTEPSKPTTPAISLLSWVFIILSILLILGKVLQWLWM